MNQTTIHLKDNVFLTNYGAQPTNSTKILASSLQFMSGGECAWYINDALLAIETEGLTEQEVKFKQGVIAKPIFTAQVQKITPKGSNVKDTKFIIFSLN